MRVEDWFPTGRVPRFVVVSPKMYRRLTEWLGGRRRRIDRARYNATRVALGHLARRRRRRLGINRQSFNGIDRGVMRIDLKVQLPPRTDTVVIDSVIG